MPKAYVMIHLEVTNEEELASDFASKIPGLLAEFGGKALVPRNTEVSILENQVTCRQADVHAIFGFQIENLRLRGTTATNIRQSDPTELTIQLTPNLPS